MNSDFESVAGAVQAVASNAESYTELGHGVVAALASHIPFDRFNIGRIDLARNLFVDEFVSGHNVAGRPDAHQRSLDGTVVEAAIQSGPGFYFGDSNSQRWLERFPQFAPVFESGIRAMLAVPLRHEDDVVAALVFASRDPHAYGQRSLALAVEIGGVVATSRVLLRIS